MNWDSALRASRALALLVTTPLALAVLGSPGSRERRATMWSTRLSACRTEQFPRPPSSKGPTETSTGRLPEAGLPARAPYSR